MDQSWRNKIYDTNTSLLLVWLDRVAISLPKGNSSLLVRMKHGPESLQREVGAGLRFLTGPCVLLEWLDCVVSCPEAIHNYLYG